MKTACGYSLLQGAIFVGFSSCILSAIMLALSIVVFTMMLNSEIIFNNSPIHSIDMIFALFTISIASYQFLLSLLLMAVLKWKKGNIFIPELWYGSHLTILILYFCLFSARFVICIDAKKYFRASATAFATVGYVGIFTYFCMIVNSYICLVLKNESSICF